MKFFYIKLENRFFIFFLILILYEREKMADISLKRVLNDVVSLLLLFGIWLTVKLAIKPTPFGFYCDDKSINMPFKSSTVSNLVLVLYALVMTGTVLVLTELVRYGYRKHKRQPTKTYTIALFDKKKELNETLRNVYIYLGSFLYGLIATYLIFQVGKKTVGRLRPYIFFFFSI